MSVKFKPKTYVKYFENKPGEDPAYANQQHAEAVALATLEAFVNWISAYFADDFNTTYPKIIHPRQDGEIGAAIIIKGSHYSYCISQEGNLGMAPEALANFLENVVEGRLKDEYLEPDPG